MFSILRKQTIICFHFFFKIMVISRYTNFIAAFMVFQMRLCKLGSLILTTSRSSFLLQYREMRVMLQYFHWMILSLGVLPCWCLSCLPLSITSIEISILTVQIILHWNCIFLLFFYILISQGHGFNHVNSWHHTNDSDHIHQGILTLTQF